MNGIRILILIFAAFAWMGHAQAADTLTESKKLTVGLVNFDFAQSVSISGDTAVFGVPIGNAAYFSTRGASAWSNPATLADTGYYGAFGRNIWIDGDTTVVSAHQHPGSRRVHVFVRTAGMWAEPFEIDGGLFRPVAHSSSTFGSAVALSGDTIIVGDPGTSKAYIFVRSGGEWSSSQQKTFGAGIPTSDKFGFSVAIDGDTALVGARTGAAYIYTRDGTTWTPESGRVQFHGDGIAGDLFGTSVALSGDTALVGAGGDNGSRGAVYVFTRDDTGWSRQAKLTTSDTDAYAFGGSSLSDQNQAVSIHGDTALIGAVGDGFGAAYVFTRDGTSWTEQSKLIASDRAFGHEFGFSVAVDERTAIVGARATNSAYVFDLVVDTDEDGIPDDEDNCPLIANAGQEDLDGDGIGDICDPDDDNDGIADNADNCQFDSNPDQTDTDTDGIGDVCDPDDDNDGVLDDHDNCSLVANPDQDNTDGDTYGDACDGDIDGDEVPNIDDNCTYAVNPDQTDTDVDGEGDECDNDDDNDTVLDGNDNCPAIANIGQENLDGDMFGDVCDGDIDGDGVPNDDDNCPLIVNTDQLDNDLDGEGDECDNDDDNDFVLDSSDNCRLTPNPSQTDNDNDGIGDVCDDDWDNDGVPNDQDNCPFVPNLDQFDHDEDGIGDACDTDFDEDSDGVIDEVDACLGTEAGDSVDIDGCSISQLCPCDGPKGKTNSWKNHGKYVSCVAHAANDFVDAGLITVHDHGFIVSEAGQSGCGARH